MGYGLPQEWKEIGIIRFYYLDRVEFLGFGVLTNCEVLITWLIGKVIML